MLIHFVASRTSLERDIEYYRRILDVVRADGHTLTTEWVEESYIISKNKNDAYAQLDWSNIYTKNMEAVAKTDLVIAEVTDDAFAVGFQVATALQQKKPTLLLQRDTGGVPSAFYPSAAKDNLLTHHFYKEEDLEKIVEAFIKENRIDNKDLRFNFFIDRQIYNYLRWAAFKTGKTKAEILRELVQREIKEREY